MMLFLNIFFPWASVSLMQSILSQPQTTRGENPQERNYAGLLLQKQNVLLHQDEKQRENTCSLMCSGWYELTKFIN